MTKMEMILTKYVNLWDVEEGRGWLVNGSTALLHLLRSSLEHSSRKFKTVFRLDPQDVSDADDPTNPRAALEVLLNRKNRDAILYEDRTDIFEEQTIDSFGQCRIETKRVTKYYRVEDRIEHIYNILEKLIDHQASIEKKDGKQFKCRPRRELFGWDFRDLVTNSGPLVSQVAVLQAMGKGWVDFTRQIESVTLFGRGFGDLIRPKQSTLNKCSIWSSLPSGKYYLAACVSDLKDMMEDNDDTTSSPMRLCKSVLWHVKQEAFQMCPCTAASAAASTHHHDPVQVLFPKTFEKRLRKKSQINLSDRGAVIFGKNRHIHWRWRDSASPERGDPLKVTNRTAVSPDDSGLGSSLGLSSSPTDSASGRVSSNLSDGGESKGLKRKLAESVSNFGKKMRR